jgi:acyl-CoA thioesterase FadM
MKLQLPETFSFSTELTVRVQDINYGGHLGNDTLFSFLQEARIRFLNTHGYSETDVCGFGLIMTDAAAVYKSQAMRGDVLCIEIAADGFNKYGCDLLYRVTERNSGKEVARAKTGIVTFDYENQKIVPAPAEFLEKLGRNT